MEAYLEPLIEGFLTRGGSVFVSPQFNVVWDKVLGEGGACPDFIALDFSTTEFVIVEVTTAASLGRLYTKIAARAANWFAPVQRHLLGIKAITPEWSPCVLCFVREDRLDESRQKFAGEADVAFQALEHAIFEYAYSAERKKGLPRA